MKRDVPLFGSLVLEHYVGMDVRVKLRDAGNVVRLQDVVESGAVLRVRWVIVRRTVAVDIDRHARQLTAIAVDEEHVIRLAIRPDI